jgi:hypothetical protein
VADYQIHDVVQLMDATQIVSLSAQGMATINRLGLLPS